MRVEGKEYDEMVREYKDTLRSLIEDFNEAIEIRTSGEQSSMYFTSHELQFMKTLLEQKEAEVDGRC